MSEPFAYGIAHAMALEDSPPAQQSVVALFKRQVNLRPGSVALEVNDRSFTYAELYSRASDLARLLNRRGVQRDDVVAICLKRTENLLVGMLGVLQAGAAYLPLNPDDPPLRLGQIVSHAGARFTVTDAISNTNLADNEQQIRLLDHPAAETTEEDPGGSESLPKPEDLAYVIYTSGTTGAPKGVAVTQGGLTNVVADIAQRVGFTEAGSWLAVTTVSFDIAALELLLPLCQGGRVILVSEEQARMGRVLAGILHRRRPTIMQATPITWRILIESGWSGLPDLTILCGGDRLDRDLAGKLLARSSAVWNMYGPTETTIWSTADKLSATEVGVTLGTPLANTQIYILDDVGRPLAQGEIGEICIAGAGLARGYIKEPELTGRYFVNASFDGDGHGNGAEHGTVRLYRTGDLGRWSEHGKLEFHGRLDHQVKINGFRVELPEIEQVLQTHPGIAEAAVLGVEGLNHQKHLYALVVSRPGAEMSKAAMVAHLAHHLPKYMIPEKFWSIPQMPSTPHGKRDVGALQALTRVETDMPV